MTRYRRIETGTLTDQKVAELSKPAPNAQTLWMYLITGKRTTPFPGLVVAKEVEIASDHGWPIVADLFTPAPANGCRCLRDAWDEIESQGMAVPDWVAGVIVLPRALLDRRKEARPSARPTSPNDFRGWAKWWDEIPDCDIKAWYLAELGRFAGALDRATVRSKKTDAYVDAYRQAFATPLQRVADAYPDAFTTRTPQRRDVESSPSVNASATRRRPTRGPVPVPEEGSGPDLPSGQSAPSGDPDATGPRDLVGEPPPISRGGNRASGAAVPAVRTEPPRSAAMGRPIARLSDAAARVLGELTGLHVKLFNAIRSELAAQVPAAQVPAMQPGGADSASRALRALMVEEGFTTDAMDGGGGDRLAAFAEAARHVLAVRADEARRIPTMMFFGASMWAPANFERGRTMRVGEDRKVAKPSAVGQATPHTSYPKGKVDLS